MGREFLVGGRNVYTYALFGLIWCLICYVGFKFSANCKIPAFIAYIILGVGLLVRIVYSVKVFGYTGDIISFSDWGARAVEYGFSGFYVKDFLKDFSWKKFFRNLVGGFSVIGGMALVAAPFGLGKVISQYTDTLGSYPYTSINAYNFWTLVGLGGRDQNTVFLFLPCSVWSNIVIVLVVLFTILILIRCRDKIYCYFLGSSFIILTMFTFAVNMHERYMFPALALVLFVFIYQPTKPVWLCYSAFSVATFCNIAWQLFNLWNRAPGNAQLLAVRISAVIVEAVVFLWDSDFPVCGDGR